MEKVHGKLSGLKKSQIKRLSNLYRRKVPPQAPTSLELTRAMGELSLEVKTPVSVLLDRRGRVVTVAVGDAADTPIPPRFGEADTRLCGLRLIHTHLKPGGLSQSDLSKLFLHRLDAMIAVELQRGKRDEVVLGPMHLAQVAPPTSEEEDWIVEPPHSVREGEEIDILNRIRALEEEMARSRASREVARSSAERAVIIGLETGEGTLEAESRLDELSELTQSAGATVAFANLQHRKTPDPRTLIGGGKLQELVSKAYHEDADLLIFDRELSPAQAREIGQVTQLKVLDRTQVILDIFAQNARGREAQVQVELAQLHYQLTRLAGRGQAMSRLGGGIGTRGPGETKLEVDRRRIRDRINALEDAVDVISKRRSETRKSRKRTDVPVIALVGYTNAGKSTLFNALSKSNALSRNQLFATLRPTTREGWLPNLGQWGSKVLYTDTVGFIRDLPSELVSAFRATLEELNDADLLLHVVDGASPGAPDRVDAVNRILDELRLEPPRLIVINKADIADPDVMIQLEERYGACGVSATRKIGLDELRSQLAAQLRKERLPEFADGFMSGTTTGFESRS
ncbi:MAG: GTPase HflX [Trueperaceae bacterium]|nr:MAG: GTPase HflX [Trueperaceae bacterium]